MNMDEDLQHACLEIEAEKTIILLLHFTISLYWVDKDSVNLKHV